MSCTSCRTFQGPICGACRAAQRIQGLLQSGRFPVAEERRVTGLLRGLAGELSDIVESFAVGGAGPAAGAHQGETSAQTTGAEQGCGAGLPVKKESSPASYSDQVDEEEEEEEEITADQEVKPDKKEEQSEEKTSKQEVQAETPQRDQHAREVKAASARTAGVLLNPASIRKGRLCGGQVS